MEWNPGKPMEAEDSIFAIMSRLSLQHGAVNLGQGFPDFDGPEWVKRTACDAIMQKSNQYANMAGIRTLRMGLADKYKSLYGLEYDFDDEITVTNGASEAIYLAITSLCGEGDEVIIFEPAYDIYSPIIRRAGATPIGVPLPPPSFHFSIEKLEDAITEKTRVLIVNSPHNPTGTVFSRIDMEAICRICQDHDLIAITDEVYEHLIFEGEHFPLATLEGMRDRTVTISSGSKTFSMTGWKVGYVLAPPEPTDLMRKLHQLVCFSVAKPLQHGIAEGIANWKKAVLPLYDALKKNRQLLAQGLNDCGFRVVQPDGTFFLVADFSKLSQENDREFAVSLIEREEGVGTIPVSSFYVDPVHAPKSYLRFCFAKQESTLVEGILRLNRILNP